jgi:hypothetical protein
MDRGEKWFFMPTQLSEGRKISYEEAPAMPVIFIRPTAVAA